MIKTLKGYWIEILLAVVFASISLTWLVFLFFIVYLISSERRTDYLRKLIRTFHIGNELKILALMEELKIDKTKVEQQLSKMKETMTEDAYKDLEKDFADVSNLSNLKY